MHAGEPFALCRTNDEAAVAHLQGTEDVVLEVLLERFAAQALDGLADPVDVDAVLPALAGVEQQWGFEGDGLAFRDERNTRMFVVAQHVRAPDVIGEASRVREQVPERDGSSWHSELRLAVGVEAFENLYLLDLRNLVLQWFVEVDLALLHELHSRD